MNARRWLLWTVPFLLVGGFLASCRTVPAVEDSARPFEQALAAVADRPNVALGSAEETNGVTRLKTLLSNLTPDSVRHWTRSTYAPDAYLNDTLKTVRGAAAIEEYFLATAANAEKITVTIQNVQRGDDGLYTFRWAMETRIKKVASGRPIRTLGISVIRFDQQGQVLVHQDYWDSAQGLFDHLPGIGFGTRAVKNRL